MATVCIEVDENQASAILEALDVYTRLCIGQIEVVGGMIRDETIPKHRMPSSNSERQVADHDALSEIDYHLNQAKRILGYPANGSHGVGHPDVAMSGHRAYEVSKVLAKCLAEYRNPAPDFRGVNYDGLLVRYTRDKAPVASIKK